MLMRVLAVVLVALGLLAAPAAAQEPVAGAPGSGDPFFPQAGNGAGIEGWVPTDDGAFVVNEPQGREPADGRPTSPRP